MTVIVGYLAGKAGMSALHLGVEAASTLKTSLSVVTVVPNRGRRRHRRASTPSTRSTPTSSPPTRRLRPRSASRSSTPTSRSASTSTRTGRRRADCWHAVEELKAEALVLGSAADGKLGQVVVGSTADRLLHSSPVPLAISPRGYRGSKSHGLTRITCGYPGTAESCARRGTRRGAGGAVRVPMRVDHLRGAGAHHVSTGGRPARRGLDPRDLGSQPEKRWPVEVRRHRRRDVELQVVTGNGWARRSTPPMGRRRTARHRYVTAGGDLAVFLGSRGTKIVRHSPVPVLVLPN